MPSIFTRLQHGWNAFRGREPTNIGRAYSSYYSSYKPDRFRITRGNERSIINAVFTRIAIDVSSLTYRHVRLNEDGFFAEIIDDGLNYALNEEANLDQTGREMLFDAALSMCDEGSVAIVPIDTDLDPTETGSYKICTLRTAKIVQWYPKYVQVQIYNEETGQKEDLVVPKSIVALIENPFYSVMNEPNSTLQRLIRKLNILDAVDEQSGSGKLDIIIQLPYVAKSKIQREQAERRRKDIENQLAGSKYGVAYADGTEKIVQLNRPAENNLLKTIEYLTSMLYGQLGITESVFNGTADEKEMLNYYNRTIEPIASAIVDNMQRKFLTKNARSRKEAIKFFRNPFQLVSMKDLAEIAQTLTAAEIASSNEVRALIGWKPDKNPRSDMLINKNINTAEEQQAFENGGSEEKLEVIQNGSEEEV